MPGRKGMMPYPCGLTYFYMNRLRLQLKPGIIRVEIHCTLQM